MCSDMNFMDNKLSEYDTAEIRKSLKHTLSENRYLHTLGVEETSVKLAKHYAVDTYKAQIAGLLHDCAKCLDDSILLEMADNNEIPVRDVERRQPYLLHGKVGALLAQTEYGVSDKEVLAAIRNHTTGNLNMSPLEKIVFIADYIEPGRKPLPGMEEIRREAYRNLDVTMILILQNTLKYLKDTKKEIDPLTEDVLNTLISNRSK